MSKSWNWCQWIRRGIEWLLARSLGSVRPKPGWLFLEFCISVVELEYDTPPDILRLLNSSSFRKLIQGWEREVLKLVLEGWEWLARAVTRPNALRPERRGLVARLVELIPEHQVPDEAIAQWRGLELFEVARGKSWRFWEEFRRFPCAVCGRPGRWRQVLPAEALPLKMAWRLRRPENHVPLCDACRRSYQGGRRVAIAARIWGARFEALQRLIQDPGCSWDRRRYPLWPAAFGGNDWREGSGRFLDGTVIHPPMRIKSNP
ncbi:hypothetical protein [Thermoflexus sp.]|uniref:hypothetical protein n=1 Tax=Thermoflexus sp. TaxID=1969742 RepID=UPI0035E431FF